MPARNRGQAIDLLTRQTIDGVLLEYNLPDATGTTLRAQLKAIRPDIPVLLYDGIGRQTPFMLRFFDSFLRNGERFGGGQGDFDVSELNSRGERRRWTVQKL